MRRYQKGLTKTIFFLSVLLMLSVFAGLIKVPFIVKEMEGNNYLFSDKTELQAFENALSQSDVPYEAISDTTICVEDTWKERAEQIYEEFMESEN